MKIRTGVVGVAALLGISSFLAGCGSDAAPAGSPAPTAGPSSSAASQPPAAADTAGLSGITFPPGATVTDLGTNQKQYEVTGMTLEAVKTFFEDQMISAGYVRAQEASASRFYDKGSKRIQITWADMQGTIRGVVRVTRS
jgi:hypothetical protein